MKAASLTLAGEPGEDPVPSPCQPRGKGERRVPGPNPAGKAPPAPLFECSAPAARLKPTNINPEAIKPDSVFNSHTANHGELKICAEIPEPRTAAGIN